LAVEEQSSIREGAYQTCYVISNFELTDLASYPIMLSLSVPKENELAGIENLWAYGEPTKLVIGIISYILIVPEGLVSLINCRSQWCGIWTK
jgi:hypothetical protein